jgi:hypothetical protein
MYKERWGAPNIPEEEEEEEVTSVQPRGHDEMSTKHTETETTTDHKRWPNEGEK